MKQLLKLLAALVIVAVMSIEIPPPWEDAPNGVHVGNTSESISLADDKSSRLALSHDGAGGF